MITKKLPLKFVSFLSEAPEWWTSAMVQQATGLTKDSIRYFTDILLENKLVERRPIRVGHSRRVYQYRLTRSLEEVIEFTSRRELEQTLRFRKKFDREVMYMYIKIPTELRYLLNHVCKMIDKSEREFVIDAISQAIAVVLRRMSSEASISVVQSAIKDMANDKKEVLRYLKEQMALHEKEETGGIEQ